MPSYGSSYPSGQGLYGGDLGAAYGTRTPTAQEQSSSTPHFVPVSTSPTETTAVFEVRLPDTFGSVAFAGVPVRGVGSTRYYVSPALPPGKVYAGTVSATWKRLGGDVVSETREVEAWAGHSTRVDFTRPPGKAPASTDRPGDAER
jgi:uncharacterized protein (TIGR03000 family)